MQEAWYKIIEMMGLSDICQEPGKYGQSAVLTREVEGAGGSIDEAILEDLDCNCNADFYIFNQGAMQD